MIFLKMALLMRSGVKQTLKSLCFHGSQRVQSEEGMGSAFP